jgi:hypothetical protein
MLPTTTVSCEMKPLTGPLPYRIWKMVPLATYVDDAVDW